MTGPPNEVRPCLAKAADGNPVRVSRVTSAGQGRASWRSSPLRAIRVTTGRKCSNTSRDHQSPPADIAQVDEPQLNAMFEAAAVLRGLKKAFSDYEQKTSQPGREGLKLASCSVGAPSSVSGQADTALAQGLLSLIAARARPQLE